MYITILLLFDSSIHQNMFIAQEVQRGEDWGVKKEGGEAENRGMDPPFAGHKKRLVTTKQGGYVLGLSLLLSSHQSTSPR